GGGVGGGGWGGGGERPDHLRAHVLKLVLKLDFLCHGDAVFADAGRAEGFVQYDIAALRPQCHTHRIGENVDAAQHLVASITREFHFFRSHVVTPEDLFCVVARRSPISVRSAPCTQLKSEV